MENKVKLNIWYGESFFAIVFLVLRQQIIALFLMSKKCLILTSSDLWRWYLCELCSQISHFIWEQTEKNYCTKFEHKFYWSVSEAEPSFLIGNEVISILCD